MRRRQHLVVPLLPSGAIECFDLRRQVTLGKAFNHRLRHFDRCRMPVSDGNELDRIVNRKSHEVLDVDPPHASHSKSRDTHSICRHESSISTELSDQEGAKSPAEVHQADRSSGTDLE